MNNNPIEITKTNGDCTKYTGTVTVASYLGDRLIKKETHHNKGLEPLFDFIGSCLQGNWYEARDKRPCKLVMLKQAEAAECLKANPAPTDYLADPRGWSTPDNTAVIDENENHYWSSKYAVCSPIMYDTAAISSNTATSSATTYHFRVPFLSLVGGSKIKKLLLLPPLASNYPTDACAYFILDDPIEVPVASANFTVIIDWTLNFSNSSAT